MPFVAQVCVGRREKLSVFGDDYDTPDGTGVRDYIHVSDLSRAHVTALERIEGLQNFEAINVGRGSGISVLELIHAFEKVVAVKIPVRFTDRRKGDAAAVWADVERAREKLKFETSFDLDTMCRDVWNWEKLKLSAEGFN